MKKVIWWIPSVFLICTNFYLSSMSWQGIREQVGWVKNIPQKEEFKVRHILQYGPLAFSFSMALAKSFPTMAPVKIFAISTALTTADGGLEEVHQSFIPSRIPSLKDVFWDLLGALLGAGLYWLLSRRFLKNPV